MTTFTECHVCRGRNVGPAFTFDGYDLYRCKNCSHLGVATIIPEPVLQAAYGRKYYGGFPGSDRTDQKGYVDYLGSVDQRLRGFQSRVQRIRRFWDKPGRLLDYGCAVGLFVKAARDAGWVAKGLERSEWAAHYGREVFGLEIEIGDGHVDPFEHESFDVVTLWDVLEHLEHPRAVLAMVWEWLRPGGLVFLNTLNSSSLGARLAGRRWRHLAPPHHLQYFTRKSLLCLLRAQGFRVRHLSGNGVVLDGRGPDHAFSKYWQPFENLMTHWRLRPVATSLNFLDELEVVALKPGPASRRG